MARDLGKLLTDLRLDEHSEENLKRVCLEVPCYVNLSYCNVNTWFEAQVQQKLKKSNKWRVYLDKDKQLSFLQRRGAFLYDKYFPKHLSLLKKYNTQLIRYIVWVQFRKTDLPDTESNLSLQTLFDTSPRSFDFDESQVSINTPGSFNFEYDLANIITSTQQYDSIPDPDEETIDQPAD